MSQSEYWAAFMRRRFSRRRLLQVGAVAGTGLWIGSSLGCGEGTSEKTSGQTGQTSPQAQGTPTPQKGGTLRITLAIGEPIGVDPFVTNHFAAPVYEKLVRQTPKRDKVIPDLATSWEIPDDVTYIFKLKPGVKFQNIPPVNGRELTAEDVKYSLERTLSEGQQYPLRSSFIFLDKVEAVDKSTVKVTTKAPFAPQLNKMAYLSDYIMPKEIVGSDNVATKAIGTGAFILDRWDKGDKMVFKRNPDYHEAGRPYLDGIEYKWAVDYVALVTVFISDQADMVTVYAQDVDTIRNKRPTAQIKQASSLSQHNYIFRSGFKPTDDIRVRQAMDLVIPRWEIALRIASGREDLYGGTATGPLPTAAENWVLPMSELEKKPGYMKKFPKADAVAQAKRLMVDAGYANGFDITMAQAPEPYEVLISQMCQEWWKEIGVRLAIQPMDWASFIAAGVKGDFQFMLYVVTGDGDPDSHLYPYLKSDSVNNWGRWNDPTLDKLLEDQRATLDFAKRKAIVYDAQRRILDQIPRMYIYDWVTFTAMHEKLRDFEPAAYSTFAGWDQFKQVWFAK